jgi:prolyl 4-hydroxylase
MNQPPDLATLKRDAERGIPGARYNLGVWYLQAPGPERDPVAARAAFEAAAATGYAPAMSALGYLYLRGQGVDPDAERAAGWFVRAADAGFPEARYRLGEMHAVGHGVEQDLAAARAAFEAAGRLGHPLAMCQLAYCLAEGLGGETDPMAATDWYGRAAVAGEPRAQCALGARYERGDTLPADPVRALSWYLRAESGGYAGGGLAAAALGDAAGPAERTQARRLADEARPVVDVPGPGAAAPRRVSVEVLSWAPRAFLFRNLLSAEERFHLIELARPFLQPALVLDRRTGERSVMEARRAHTARMRDPLRDVVVWNLERRLAERSLLPAENAEPFTIIRYGPGDEYRPHADYYDPADPGSRTGLAQGGQRVATFLAWLNRPAAGGATSFPRAELSVEPTPGAGLLFFNCRPDGEPDPTTVHAGEPVTAGEKWLASRWIRAGRFRPL